VRSSRPSPPTEEVTIVIATRPPAIVSLIACLALGTAACGSGGEGDAGATTNRPAGSTTTRAPAPTITAGPVSTTSSADATSSTALTVADEAWRGQVDQACAEAAEFAALQPPAGDRASLEAFVARYRAAFDGNSPVTGLPPGPGRTQRDLDAAWAFGLAALDRAAAGAAAGDLATVMDETGAIPLGFLASAYASAGQSCGPADADRAAEASLNVSILGPWQVEVGYGSVWVSQSRSPNVVRIDPGTGEALATVEVPSAPGKLQPADGRMIVRTGDSYVAIDAATNTVVGRLLKADVGPNANRSWAVDGALWICDGQRLHRYDPTTFQPVATIDLDIECGQVHATPEVVTAWTYNEDPGESGVSRAAFIDPMTNAVVTTVDLAGDATVPIVLDDVVFFGPAGGSTATIVDRATLTATATPDLGRTIDGGSQGAFDGTNIYLIADKPTGTIAVIDPDTFEVTGEVRAIATAPSLNSLAATPGVLWSVNNSGGLLQRFDRDA
jgi:hypothetical protein